MTFNDKHKMMVFTLYFSLSSCYFHSQTWAYNGNRT